ncbi:MAG: hypothetical protein ABJD11_16320 [Gemmatimonadota bacterium]
MPDSLTAVLGTLVFLGAGFGLLLSAIAVIALALSGRRKLARQVTLLSGAAVAIYAIVLSTVSIASVEQVLPAGAEKYFCELDCHLAYSVAAVHAAPETAGQLYVLSLRTRFDERTISPSRGEGELYPNPRGIWLVDAAGRSYEPIADAGQGNAGADSMATTPVSTPLRPGQSYITRLTFELPATARDPKLLLTESEWPTWFVIGHENSLLHRKTLLELPRAVTAER